MLDKNQQLLIAKTDKKNIYIHSKMANRHGLVTGATGTGKTVTLQTLAETFSAAGIPVFAADIKGDLSGVSQVGGGNSKVEERVKKLNLAAEGFKYQSFPVVFWDLFGEQGHPLRTTVSEIGPFLFSRLLGLNEVQTGVMNLVFKIADDNGLLLLDLKDLKKMLEFIGNNAEQFTTDYGTVSKSSIGTIQRNLLTLEQQGVVSFLGEPAFDIDDLIQTHNGLGNINIIAADKLMFSPRVYSTFLLWLLSELFERLPEMGDLDKPRLAFFFDEAHLLFHEAPKALVDKIEQTVRLIRSKGVGIYFVTQTPSDIPEKILGQLGNRLQHALRAFTPNDEKAIKAAANTFRSNPALKTEKVITELAVGEALVSFLDEKGIPQIVEKSWIIPPEGQIGAITSQQRANIIRQSPYYGKYENVVDRESAFEILQARMTQNLPEKQTKSAKGSSSILEQMAVQVGKSATRQIGNQLARSLVRGVLGSLFRKGR